MDLLDDCSCLLHNVHLLDNVCLQGYSKGKDAKAAVCPTLFLLHNEMYFFRTSPL